MCMLHKAIYGFEESPMALFGEFSEAVIKFRLQCCHLIALCFLIPLKEERSC